MGERGLNLRKGLVIGGDEGGGGGGSSSTNDWYGIMYDETESSPIKLRVGNDTLHKTLPVHNGMRRCLLNNDGTVNYYLDPNDSTKKADGTAADLTGADGMVMVEVPEHWRLVTKNQNTITAAVSAKMQPGWLHVKKYYVSAYQATVDNTNTSKKLLASVANTTAAFRGGDGTHSSDDSTYKTMLGMPASNITMANFRTYARNRGASGQYKWNIMVYDLYIDLYWLYVIEYANTNCQAAFNSALTAEGYKQGGLGPGVTNLVNENWTAFNDRYPFVRCGSTNSLGDATGVVNYTMPFQYDAVDPAAYAGEYDAEVESVANKYYSSGELLYKCIFTNTGESLDDTNYYTPVTRTVVEIPSWHGIENPFGHIWTFQDGIKIYRHGVYRCFDPSKYSSSANVTNYSLIGTEASTNNYVTRMLITPDGDIMASQVGGGDTQYYCDYHYMTTSTSQYSCCLAGGGAGNGANAGLACLLTNSTVTFSDTIVGSRLCFYNP